MYFVTEFSPTPNRFDLTDLSFGSLSACSDSITHSFVVSLNDGPELLDHTVPLGKGSLGFFFRYDEHDLKFFDSTTRSK